MPSLPTSLSPAELAFLHSSLSATPPIRPDSRTAVQFRPLTAETDVLPSTNGSAHLSFSDGSEAIVGVKAEVEKTKALRVMGLGEGDDEELQDAGAAQVKYIGSRVDWVDLSIDISGLRDDDPLLVFLSEMMREALLSGGGLTDSLVINHGWHWKLCIDVLLLSPFSSSSLPLPLLSLTTHLALLSSRLPALKSQGEEDPLFDDDWAAATYLYPRLSITALAKLPLDDASAQQSFTKRPPVTLLVIVVGQNTIFDPSREELAVADTILAISLGNVLSDDLHILSMRMLDTSARDTFAGVPATGQEVLEKVAREGGEVAEGVWVPRRGGVKRAALKEVMRSVVEVAKEVVEGLEGFSE